MGLKVFFRTGQSPVYLIQTSMEVFVQYKLQWEIQFSVNLYIVQLTSLFDCVRIPYYIFYK